MKPATGRRCAEQGEPLAAMIYVINLASLFCVLFIHKEPLAVPNLFVNVT